MDLLTELEALTTLLERARAQPGVTGPAYVMIVQALRDLRRISVAQAGAQREGICERAGRRFVERPGSWRP